MSSNYNLFATEESVIESFSEKLAQKSHFEASEIEQILKEYKKLFKSTKRLVRMSDRKEKELNSLNTLMKEKNALLELLSERLSRYISPQLAKTILEDKQDVLLETSRKKLTIFFSDIVGFAEIADKLESEELTYHLNAYLEEMTKVALEYGATIDKYMGDSLMVFFGDPVSKGVKEDALLCVQMALEMRKRIRSLINNGTILPFKTRIGINTGYGTVGNFGSKSRMDYTVIGKEVNIASRLEGVANEGEIVVSDATYQLVKENIKCEERGVFELKGVSHPVKAYRVDGKKSKGKNSSHIFDTELFGGAASINIDSDKLTQEEKQALLKFLEDVSEKLRYEEKLERENQ